jgi:radical SAM superfamily enzyme
MLATADTVAGLPVDGVKLHLLYVVRGTALERLYRGGGFQCLEQEAYVDLVCDVIERLPGDMVIQRLTGDPHRHELVAPMWALDKNTNVAMIRRRLEERDTWQGKAFERRTKDSPRGWDRKK